MMRSVAGLFLVLIFQDFNGHIVDSLVVENYNATVGTRLDVNSGILPNS